ALAPLNESAIVNERRDRLEPEVSDLCALWTRTVDAQREIAPERETLPTQANVIGLVNDSIEERDVVVCAAGGMPGELLKLWRTVDPKGYHVEYGFSCMGYEIAGGLGVKMADPSREVIVMVGDGSYLMLHTEIVTSIQEGVKLTIVLVDNSGFQCIRGLQMASGSPSFGNELRFRDPATGRIDGDVVPVDFVRNAESLGAVAYTANNVEELRHALATARNESRTTLVYIRVDSEERVPSYEGWWDVPIAEVSGEQSVNDARDEYERDIKRQHVFV
ncbi:MAG: thiamine pyrophosphate-dependent enzyme, partial [Thermomicrobiales bacterium]